MLHTNIITDTVISRETNQTNKANKTITNLIKFGNKLILNIEKRGES